jgi:polar amino acid transport system permease protein
MNLAGNSAPQAHPRAVRLLLVLVAITVGASLLYAIQVYTGGPVQLPVVSELYDLVVSPAGPWVAAGAEDGTVRLWDPEHDWAMRTLTGHKGGVIGLALGADNSTLVSAGRDGTLRVWDVTSGTEKQKLEAGEEPLTDISLSPEVSRLAAVDEAGSVGIWDLATGKMIQSLGPNGSTGRAVALSPDGLLVAADDGVNIGIWEVGTGQLVRTLEGYCVDETLTTQDECEDADQDWMGHDKEVTVLAFSPDGTLLASGSADTRILFWDPETGEVMWEAGGHWATVTKLVFNSESDGMVSGGEDSKARTWRIPGGKITATFEGHLSAINGVAYGWEPDTIVTAGDDGTVRVWETVNQRVIHLQWAQYGLQSIWGRVLRDWMLISGLLGLVGLWALWKRRAWGHLLVLALYVIGPIVVLGLPLLEVFIYDLPARIQFQIGWPVFVVLVWYAVVAVVMTREPVIEFYGAPESLDLSARLMASQRMVRSRFGIFTTAVWILVLVVLYSVLRRFHLDVSFMNHWLSFIMEGSWITARVSAISIALATVLALIGAIWRLSKNPLLNGISGFYISLIRGTPLLVQVYIWYLGLPRVGIILEGEVAGILALGVNYGAYMTEIFRAGIQAIGVGQHEAAQALGMSRTQTLRRIVLPQAFRIVIPPIGNEFIAMMKDSSLVSLMVVWELAYRANKIGRQYFRGLETYIIAAAFYWILTVIFQLLQGKLEEYMARGERR